MPDTPSVPSDLFVRPRPGEIACPATETEIAAAESALGVTLPPAYKAVLLVRNGGSLLRSIFSLKVAPPKQSHARKKYQVSSLAGVGTGAGENIVEMRELAGREWDVPAMLLPLCGDGHWWCCLDYRVCGPHGEPSIAHYETAEDGRDVDFLIAESFHTLIKGLRVDPESLTPALIALDEGAPVDAALDAVLERIGCKRADMGIANPKFPLPPRWTWGKYASFVKGCPAGIEVWRNRWRPESTPLTTERSETHPMLRVFIAADTEQACLNELLGALGRGAVLLHGLR
ncbi:MAG: SMI1/KNR4 family protein [Planctomycetes bacterium]|nr:SMI1/KNR4 family protein [Planctomycetota bacterium]